MPLVMYWNLETSSGNVMEEISGGNVWKVMRCRDLRSDVEKALWFGDSAYQRERGNSTISVAI